MTANQLAKLLRTAVESGQCSDGLERAVRSFIREERLTTRHMAEVLLGGAVFPAQLRQQVLTAIDPSATDRHPVSVLNTLKTLSPEWAVREQFEQSGDGQWCCRLEAAGRVAAAAAGAKAQARQEAALVDVQVRHELPAAALESVAASHLSRPGSSSPTGHRSAWP